MKEFAKKLEEERQPEPKVEEGKEELTEEQKK